MSQGAYLENLAQFGIFRDFAYSLDYYHYSDPGFRPNNDINNEDFQAKVKLQLTAKDTFLVQVERSEIDAGDVRQLYAQTNADTALRTKSMEDPSTVLGYHRQWSPGQDTLILFRNLQQSFTLNDPNFGITSFTEIPAPFHPPTNGIPLLTAYSDQAQMNSIELQHIMQTDMHRLILGARYQNENDQVTNYLDRLPSGFTPGLPVSQSIATDFTRFTAYGYYQIRLLDQLRLTAGLTYDHMRFPLNSANAPVMDREDERDKFSAEIRHRLDAEQSNAAARRLHAVGRRVVQQQQHADRAERDRRVQPGVPHSDAKRDGAVHGI